MNQIIQLCIQRAESSHLNTTNRNSSCEYQVPHFKHSNERSQEETEPEEEICKKVNSQVFQILNLVYIGSQPLIYKHTRTNFKVYFQLMRSENTPQLQQKLESMCIDEESFNLDDILFNECENLSHISENANNSEKWQEESIDSLLYNQKQKEEDEERKQQELEYFQILNVFEQPKIQRIPENIKAILETHKIKIIQLCPLKLQCDHDHIWETKFDEILQNKFCALCKHQQTIFTNNSQQENLRKNANHAKCILNPCWPSKFKCNECKVKSKQDLKKQKLDNLKKTYEIYEKEQNEIYLQAVRALQSQNQGDKLKIIKAFKETEMEVDKAAKNHALRFCKKINANPLDLIQQITIIYKILLLPEGPLEQYVKSQQRQILKNEYKQYAKFVHPDKNPHPQANTAFKKMKKYWLDIPKMISINNNNIN